MTVALLAKQHRKHLRTALLSVGLGVFVILGGWFSARELQVNIAQGVTEAIGLTVAPVSVTVDGRQVVVSTPHDLTTGQRADINSVPGIGRLTVEVGP